MSDTSGENTEMDPWLQCAMELDQLGRGVEVKVQTPIKRGKRDRNELEKEKKAPYRRKKQEKDQEVCKKKKLLFGAEDYEEEKYVRKKDKEHTRKIQKLCTRPHGNEEEADILVGVPRAKGRKIPVTMSQKQYREEMKERKRQRKEAEGERNILEEVRLQRQVASDTSDEDSSSLFSDGESVSSEVVTDDETNSESSHKTSDDTHPVYCSEVWDYVDTCAHDTKEVKRPKKAARGKSKGMTRRNDADPERQPEQGKLTEAEKIILDSKEGYCVKKKCLGQNVVSAERVPFQGDALPQKYVFHYLDTAVLKPTKGFVGESPRQNDSSATNYIKRRKWLKKKVEEIDSEEEEKQNPPSSGRSPNKAEEMYEEENSLSGKSSAESDISDRSSLVPSSCPDSSCSEDDLKVPAIWDPLVELSEFLKDDGQKEDELESDEEEAFNEFLRMYKKYKSKTRIDVPFREEYKQSVPEIGFEKAREKRQFRGYDHYGREVMYEEERKMLKMIREKEVNDYLSSCREKLRQQEEEDKNKLCVRSSDKWMDCEDEKGVDETETKECSYVGQRVGIPGLESFRTSFMYYDFKRVEVDGGYMYKIYEKGHGDTEAGFGSEASTSTKEVMDNDKVEKDEEGVGETDNDVDEDKEKGNDAVEEHDDYEDEEKEYDNEEEEHDDCEHQKKGFGTEKEEEEQVEGDSGKYEEMGLKTDMEERVGSGRSRDKKKERKTEKNEETECDGDEDREMDTEEKKAETQSDSEEAEEKGCDMEEVEKEYDVEEKEEEEMDCSTEDDDVENDSEEEEEKQWDTWGGEKTEESDEDDDKWHTLEEEMNHDDYEDSEANKECVEDEENDTDYSENEEDEDGETKSKKDEEENESNIDNTFDLDDVRSDFTLLSEIKTQPSTKSCSSSDVSAFSDLVISDDDDDEVKKEISKPKMKEKEEEEKEHVFMKVIYKHSPAYQAEQKKIKLEKRYTTALHSLETMTRRLDLILEDLE